MIDALIEALAPEVRASIDDVDRALIALALQHSPWDRLRSAVLQGVPITTTDSTLSTCGGPRT
jgi:hypothetical protein